MGIGESLSHLDGRVRPSLAKVIPASSFVAMYSLARSPMLRILARERPTLEVPSFPVEFGDLHFRNDLGNAAGYDKDGELLPLNYLMGAGFAVVGTVLVSPNDGNYLSSSLKVNPWTPLPASHGAINSLGLPSKGVDDVVRNVYRFREGYQPEGFPIGASIMGHPKQEGEEKLEGMVECLKRLLPYVDFVEINESCPNVHHSDDGDTLEYRMGKLVSTRDAYQSESGRKVTLLVKLGSFGDPEHTVRFMTGMNVDGLVGLNTQKNYEELRKRVSEKDHRLFDHYIRIHKGGVSGEPIRDFSYEQVRATAEEIRRQDSQLKLIHVGGIRSYKDMERSRGIGEPVILREWYTGMMEVMATTPFNQVYREVVAGDKS